MSISARPRCGTVRSTAWSGRAPTCGRPTFAAGLAGLNLAVLADYAGLRISDSEQSEILKQLGVEVCIS